MGITVHGDIYTKSSGHLVELPKSPMVNKIYCKCKAWSCLDLQLSFLPTSIQLRVRNASIQAEEMPRPYQILEDWERPQPRNITSLIPWTASVRGSSLAHWTAPGLAKSSNFQSACRETADLANDSYAQYFATGTRTRVARVRAEYPNQLDYSGAVGIVQSSQYCAE